LVVQIKSCVVCGLDDARALVMTELDGGKSVIVCATHALIHRTLGGTSRTVEELKANVRDRRRPGERRESLPCDELGAMLLAGFAGERRAGSERRGL
jgi:hypothetical protein